MYSNLDTITNKLDELKARVNVENPTIIALTEIKPKNARYSLTKEELNINGYNIIATNLENKTGRGVCIYVKDTLICNKVEFDADFQESVWTAVD